MLYTPKCVSTQWIQLKTHTLYLTSGKSSWKWDWTNAQTLPSYTPNTSPKIKLYLPQNAAFLNFFKFFLWMMENILLGHIWLVSKTQNRVHFTWITYQTLKFQFLWLMEMHLHKHRRTFDSSVLLDILKTLCVVFIFWWDRNFFPQMKDCCCWLVSAQQLPPTGLFTAQWRPRLTERK